MIADIHDYSPGDGPEVQELNRANEPDVGPLDDTRLEVLTSEALLVRVVRVDTQLVGALFVLAEGGSYGSPNYRWFGERHDRFAYVDRIMLAPAARGLGLGPRLYDEASTAAREAGKPVLCAEVNTVPANDRSFRFHELYGFREVARQRPYGGDEEVAMFELHL